EGQEIPQREGAGDEREHHGPRALARLSFRVVPGAPQQANAGRQNPGEHGDQPQIRERSARVVAPGVAPNTERGRRAGQGNRRAEDPAEQRRHSQIAPTADVDGSEVKDRGRQKAGENRRNSRPPQGARRSGALIDGRESGQPASRRYGDAEKQQADQRSARARHYGEAEYENGRRGQKRRQRKAVRRPAGRE